MVEGFKDHPAIMAWYINDEFPISMVQDLSGHQKLMEALDPGRPTWVVLYQVDEVRAYLPTFDVIGTDPYPIPHKPASVAGEYARKTVQAVMGARAVWMVPQIFNWASYKDETEDKKACRPPTLEEMRSMAWQCIANGANGLVFYSWFDLWRMSKDVAAGGKALVPEPFEDRWRDVTLMADEIKKMMPILLSVEPPVSPSKLDASEGVACRLYGTREGTVLVAVNGRKEQGQLSVQFPGTVSGCEALLGPALAPMAGNGVQMSLGPLEVRIVRCKGDLGAPAQP